MNTCRGFSLAGFAVGNTFLLQPGSMRDWNSVIEHTWNEATSEYHASSVKCRFIE